MLILMMMFIYMLFTGLLVVLSVAFVTLLERKVLGLVQNRPGPNKVGVMGIGQPISDGLKLLSKSSFDLIYVTGVRYYLMPIFMFLFMVMLWGLIPSGSMLNSFSNSGLIMICLMSLGVLPVIWGGWFSLSVYSMVGSVRSVAQMISYEVSLIFIFMGFYSCIGSFKMMNFIGFSCLAFMLPYVFLLFFSSLMELNRSPSDLIEGESELVSGFNIEFYGMNFSLIFLGEYGSILFMSSFMVLMIFGVDSFSLLGLFILLMLLNLIILIRGALPRLRYDFLMYFCWTSVISVSLGYLILVVGLLGLMW